MKLFAKSAEHAIDNIPIPVIPIAGAEPEGKQQDGDIANRQNHKGGKDNHEFQIDFWITDQSDARNAI